MSKIARSPLANYFDAHPKDTQNKLSVRMHKARGWGNPPPQSLISKWVTGHQVPHITQRAAIEAATNGFVSIADWEAFEKARTQAA